MEACLYADLEFMAASVIAYLALIDCYCSRKSLGKFRGAGWYGWWEGLSVGSKKILLSAFGVLHLSTHCSFSLSIALLYFCCCFENTIAPQLIEQTIMVLVDHVILCSIGL